MIEVHTISMTGTHVMAERSQPNLIPQNTVKLDDYLEMNENDKIDKSANNRLLTFQRS